jgi:hypothetical protein
MPIDADPHPAWHPPARTAHVFGTVRRAIVGPAPERAKHAGRLHLAHFASCPYAPVKAGRKVDHLRRSKSGPPWHGGENGSGTGISGYARSEERSDERSA